MAGRLRKALDAYSRTGKAVRGRALAIAKEQARLTGESLTDVLNDPEMMATVAAVIAAEAGTGGAATPVSGAALSVAGLRYAQRRSARMKASRKNGRRNGDVHGKDLEVFGHTLSFDRSGNMHIARGKLVDTGAGDYGTDPVFDPNGNPTGYVKLIPSGQIVLAADARKLLAARKNGRRTNAPRRNHHLKTGEWCVVKGTEGYVYPKHPQVGQVMATKSPDWYRVHFIGREKVSGWVDGRKLVKVTPREAAALVSSRTKFTDSGYAGATLPANYKKHSSRSHEQAYLDRWSLAEHGARKNAGHGPVVRYTVWSKWAKGDDWQESRNYSLAEAKAVLKQYGTDYYSDNGAYYAMEVRPMDGGPAVMSVREGIFLKSNGRGSRSTNRANPLVKGYSKASISKNISSEVRAGKPQKQAVAIAFSVAERAFRKRHPGARLPAHLRQKGRK